MNTCPIPEITVDFGDSSLKHHSKMQALQRLKHSIVEHTLPREAERTPDESPCGPERDEAGDGGVATPLDGVVTATQRLGRSHQRLQSG